MLHDIIFFLLGLVLILLGGNYVTDGSVAIARRFNISTLVIGVTVVAFGSSTPDFVVCLTSTLKGHSSLALGDIVGANIFDILLVAGILALIRPVPVDRNSRSIDLPLLALSSLAIFFCGDDVIIDGAKSNIVSRTDGLLLLAFFVIFMALTLAAGKAAQATLPTPTAARTDNKKPFTPTPAVAKPSPMKFWLSIVSVLGGLAALVVGGNWLVDGASGIALKAGLPEGLVGLTIVGIGSSLPDLATSVIAALKRQPGIALGNILGACIFNVFFIIGFCSTISPLSASTISALDFGALAFGAIVLWLFGSVSKKRQISRSEGVVLVALYIIYMVKLVMDFLHA